MWGSEQFCTYQRYSEVVCCGGARRHRRVETGTRQCAARRHRNSWTDGTWCERRAWVAAGSANDRRAAPTRRRRTRCTSRRVTTTTATCWTDRTRAHHSISNTPTSHKHAQQFCGHFSCSHGPFFTWQWRKLPLSDGIWSAVSPSDRRLQ